MNINKNDTLNSVEHIVYARLAILSYGLDSNVTKLNYIYIYIKEHTASLCYYNGLHVQLDAMGLQLS